MRQLLLPFPDETTYAEADFVPADSNAAVRAWLDRPSDLPYSDGLYRDGPYRDWPDRRLAIWGDEGCGKTHLLHIWASRSGASVWSGMHLRGLPEALPAAGIAIDDADTAPSATVLLHWLNAARDAGVPVLLTSRVPPAAFSFTLPDLMSRLRAILAVRVGLAEDALLRTLLDRMLAERQWRLPDDIRAWLLPLLPRSPAELRAMVARLDRYMLTHGGRLTQRAVGAVLGDMPE